jgi:hypothetical protein
MTTSKVEATKRFPQASGADNGGIKQELRRSHYV